jgi:hypothetical protein
MVQRELSRAAGRSSINPTLGRGGDGAFLLAAFVTHDPT